MKNIKVSKTFSIIVILIIAGFTLIPNIISSYTIYKSEENKNSYTDQIEQRNERLNKSFSLLNIPDEGLRSCIAQELQIYNGIHPENGGIDNVIGLERLNCFGLNIKSLEGIYQFQDLKILDISNNPVTNLQPLLVLEKLEYLSLSDNEVDDLGFLLKLNSLKKMAMPNTENIFCAKVISFMDKAPFTSLGAENAKSNCIGNEKLVHQEEEIKRLQAKKNFGEHLSNEEEIKLLKYEINRKQIDYNKKYGE